jgi:hypothetical protein
MLGSVIHLCCCNPINKWASELNRQVLEEVQMANKYMKKVQLPGHQGNADQNIEISSHPSHNVYQEFKPTGLGLVSEEAVSHSTSVSSSIWAAVAKISQLGYIHGMGRVNEGDGGEGIWWMGFIYLHEMEQRNLLQWL